MKLNKSLIVLMLTGFVLALPVQADDDSVMQSINDARLEGQLWTAYALNRHLSPFDIDVDVDDGEATLSGTVEESVQRDLAEQIALGTNGIDKVDNKIEVSASADRRSASERGQERRFGDRVSDATTTATVKSKLLWNRNTGGLSINVDTRNGVVTLEGEADSEASKELAERLAINTDGVESVDNRLRVSGEGASARRDVGDTVSDSWITTKVKSTLLFSRDVPGTDISVETRNGVVTLEGEVEHAAAKSRAVELAADIRGVRQVNADAVRVAGG